MFILIHVHKPWFPYNNIDAFTILDGWVHGWAGGLGGWLVGWLHGWVGGWVGGWNWNYYKDVSVHDEADANNDLWILSVSALTCVQ